MTTTPTSTPPTLEDLQRATPRVLERLRDMAPFPVHGTVAGQAVASLFWEELGLEMRGPVNDIDVFVNYKMPRAMRGGLPAEANPARSGHRAQRTVSNYKDVRIKEDDYGQTKVLAMRATTGILRTYTSGLVNYTLLSPSHQHKDIGHLMVQSQELVDEFDLNLVAVGINLDEEKVVASLAFLKFLSDRQVRAQTCNTPAHTLVRLVNKLHSGQLEGVECDYPAQRQMLELAIACQDLIAPLLPYEEGHGPRRITRFGSGKYKALALKFAHLLPTTYTQITDSNYEFTHFKVEPAATPQAKWLLEHAGPLVSMNPSSLGHQAYVARFPVLYGLFHPEVGADLDPSLRAARIQSLKDALGAEEPETFFRLIQFALGNETPDIALKELSAMEVANFFFNQDMTPAQCRDIAIQWNGLAPLEARLLKATGVRAGDFKKLCADPDAGWEALFTSHCQTTYSFFSDVRPSKLSANSPSRLAERFLSWLANPENSHDNAFALSIVVHNPTLFSVPDPDQDPKLSLNTVFPTRPRSLSTAHKLLRLVRPDLHESLGDALVNAKCQEWQEGPHGNSIIPGVIVRMDMGLAVTQGMITELSDKRLVAHCILDACSNIDLNQHKSAHQALMPLALELIPDEIMANEGQVLRSLAYTAQGPKLLEAIKPQIEHHPGLDRCLDEALAFVKAEMQELDSSSTSTSRQSPLEGLARARATLEAWSMSRRTQPTVTPAVSFVRQAPRF